MGVVYLADDALRGGQVALKLLPRTDAGAVRGLKREFRSVADITHPNLVQLYELLGGDAGWFFTMEVVRGVDFVTAAAGGPRGTGAGRHEALAEVTEPEITLTSPGDPAAAGPGGGAQGVASTADRVARLRRLLPQLVSGVSTLHAAGKLHLDLKPSNVMVDPEGRVVVLDFGLTRDLAGLHAEPASRAATPSYAAPEQLQGGPPGPAADWYAVGGMVFHVLTGRAPHGRLSERRAELREGRRAPRPSAVVAGVPVGLDELCWRLLDPDPRRRADGTDLSEWAGEELPETTDPGGGTFVGRRRDLAAVDAAYQRARAGPGVVLLVHGPGGMGKSALLRRAWLPMFVSGAWVLTGRCHERETVPFNAFDQVIDQLAERGRAVAGVVAPEGAADLVRMFPALQTLLPSVPLGGEPVSPRDDPGLRARAFLALRDLLSQVAAWRPLVLCLDDLQWGDGDSAKLLVALMQPPAPQGVVVLGSYRSEGRGTSVFLQALDASPVEVQHHALGALTAREVRELGRELGAAERGWSREALEGLAREGAATPFFVEQVIRFGAPGGAETGTLRSLMQARFDGLPAPERALLDAVAVSGVPIRTDVALRVAGVGADAGRALTRLMNGRLLRSGPGGRVLEPWHDRIRELAVAELPVDRRVATHLALAADYAEHAADAVTALGRIGDGEAATPALADRAAEALPYVQNLAAAEALRPGAAPGLARLQLAAGLVARTTRAYAVSLDLLRRAAASLAGDAWSRDRATAWRTHLELMRALALDGAFEEVLGRIPGLSQHARDEGERDELVLVRLQALISLYRPGEALDAAVEALARLGVRLTRHPGKCHVAVALVTTLAALRLRTPRDLADRPPMTDRRALVALAVLRRVITASFLASPDLFPLLALQMVRLELRYGVAADGAAGWATFGIVMAAVLGDPPRGVGFGELAGQTAERSGAPEQRAAVLALVGGYLHHWTRPAAESLPLLREGLAAGIGAGELEFAGTCGSLRVAYTLLVGRPLDEVAAVAEEARSALTRIGQEQPRQGVLRVAQWVANLKGQGGDPWTLSGPLHDEDAMLAVYRAHQDTSSIAAALTFRALARFMFGDLVGATAAIEEAAAHADGVLGTLLYPELQLVLGLVRSAHAWRAAGARRWWLARGVVAPLQALRGAARWCPENHGHAVHLLEAELWALRGDTRAAAAYVEAGSGARAAGRLHHEALAWEAAARAAALPEEGAAAWAAARDAWRRWGAVTRVMLMPATPDRW